MKRLIKDNELIMAIANWQQTLMPGWNSPDDADSIIYETLEEVCRLIESQPPADNWIPCSERLPKESGEYLVNMDYEGMPLVTIKYFTTVGSEPNRWLTFRKVTAWQHKPEPYKDK